MNDEKKLDLVLANVKEMNEHLENMSFGLGFIVGAIICVTVFKFLKRQ